MNDGSPTTVTPPTEPVNLAGGRCTVCGGFKRDHAARDRRCSACHWEFPPWQTADPDDIWTQLCPGCKQMYDAHLTYSIAEPELNYPDPWNFHRSGYEPLALLIQRKAGDATGEEFDRRYSRAARRLFQHRRRPLRVPTIYVADDWQKRPGLIVGLTGDGFTARVSTFHEGTLDGADILVPVGHVFLPKSAAKRDDPRLQTESLYRMHDTLGRLLYIGITRRGATRFDEHSSTKPWWTQVATITVTHYPDRAAVETAERDAIRAERPLYNQSHNEAKVEL